MRLLVFDPSGNKSASEGSGTTGWCVFDNGGLIRYGHERADNYETIEEYWNNVCNLITLSGANTILCESFKLFAHKAQAQSWSAMETSQLIGALRLTAYLKGVPVVFQDPAVKVRVTDEILSHEGVFEKKGNRYFCMGRQSIIHERDSIRHGVFYLRYGKK